MNTNEMLPPYSPITKASFSCPCESYHGGRPAVYIVRAPALTRCELCADEDVLMVRERRLGLRGGYDLVGVLGGVRGEMDPSSWSSPLPLKKKHFVIYKKEKLL